MVNKSDLTAHVAKATGITQAQAGNAINAIVDTIQEALATGGDVTLVGFGSFSVSERDARTGRNPQTGEPIQIAASRLPHFKPGQTLKTAVALKVAASKKSADAPVAKKSKKKKK